jgi:hypothetical protein
LGVARTPAKCLPHLVRLPVKTVALCDVDAKRLGQIGDRYGVTPRYADAAEPLADEELDAIGMAVGPALHGELGIQALSRGLPVFMEKPPLRLPMPPNGLLMKPHVREALHRRFHETLLDREPNCRNILRSGSFRSPPSILGQ